MKTLEKLIKDAVGANKYKSGVKEALQSIKGSKLIIVSRSIAPEDMEKLKEQTESANVALYEYPGTSMQLGKLCNRPFRITAIAIKSGTADEISTLLAEKRGK
ncbi:MAG: ribosomal L7Ae/L30e/S12e/Gadd45 family protein [Thermoproteota archaeon]|jgi:large subunit ribosomal protein L30e|nr:ribosomal L7Ae/L30e/S12e/Gadd45 family protein [Thermoproteota archaeon]